jgi:APA family basic amino acid/polyamine antiporter
MIGSGIFITTGIVLNYTHNALVIIILWAVGGLVALTGALCYAELAAMWPEAGGEYVYLRNTYGFLPAFLTGWISLMVGFSASVALSAMMFIEYLNKFSKNLYPDAGEGIPFFADIWTQKCVAAGILILLGVVHILGVREGSTVQNVLTIIKIAIIATFIGFGVYMADWSMSQRLVADYSWPDGSTGGGIPAAGLALLVIMFSYSGWNGAAYIAGEIRKPEINLPRALILGTVITTILYLGLNAIFLMSAPGGKIIADAAGGEAAIGALAASSLFGENFSHILNLGIALILLSSISAQMMIGPRVYYAMANDKMIFNPLARIHPRLGTPHVAICVQMLLAVAYVFLGSAQTLMEYMGFALSVFPLLTIIGLMILRKRHPELQRPYRIPAYPLTALVYIVLTLAMMITAIFTGTKTALFAIGVILIGIPIFYIWRKYSPDETDSPEGNR